MQRSPFENQDQRASRQFPSVHFQRFYDDQCLRPRILGVEVRWLMIILEHLDHNAKETTDLRHTVSPGSAGNAPRLHSFATQHTTRVPSRTMSIWRIECLTSGPTLSNSSSQREGG